MHDGTRSVSFVWAPTFEGDIQGLHDCPVTVEDMEFRLSHIPRIGETVVFSSYDSAVTLATVTAIAHHVAPVTQTGDPMHHIDIYIKAK